MQLLLRAAALAPFLLCGLASSATAKGGPGADNADAAPAGLFSRSAPRSQLSNRSRSACPVTASDCTDLDFRYSACGRAELARIRDTGAPSQTPSVCEAVCAGLTPSAANCRDQEWYNTICGLLERSRMSLEPTFAASSLGNPNPPPPAAVCSQSLITEAAQPNLGLGGEPVAEVVVPELSCATGTCVSTPGTRTNVRKPAFDRDDQQILPMQSLYYGLITEDFTELSKSDSAPGPDYQAIFFDRIRQNWSDNDNDIGKPCAPADCTPFPRIAHGCYEYVYEKYYDWARFTDAIAPLGDDLRAVWNVAFDPSPTQARTNIGYRGVNGTPLSTLDGVPTDPQLQFPGGLRAKNVFHTLAYSLNDGSGNMYGYGLADLLPGSDGLMKVKLDNAALAQEMATRVSSYPGHMENWAYHQAQGNALMPLYLDSEFESYERFVESFEELISRRAAVNAAILELLLHNFAEGVTWFNEQPIFNEVETAFQTLIATGDPVARRLAGAKAYQRALQGRAGLVENLNPTALSQQFAFNQDVFGLDLPETGFTTYSNETPIGPTGGGQRFGSIGAIQPRRSGGLGPVTNNPYLQLTSFALWGDLTTVGLDEIDMLFAALDVLDGQIQGKLVEAKALGCIVDGDLIGATPTPCDWSPRSFRDRMQDPYSSVREVDYRRCRDHTVGSDLELTTMRQVDNLDFLHLPYPQNNAFCSPGSSRSPFPDGPNAGLCIVELDGDLCIGDFRDRGVPGVEEYMDCYDKWILDVQKGLEAILDEPLYNPKTMQVEVGKQASDSYELGGKMFGVEFDYAGAWQLGGASIPAPASDADYCALDASLHGSIGVTGKAFYQSVDLMDAAVDISLQQPSGNQVYLELFGKEVFGVDSIDLSVDTVAKGGDQLKKSFLKYEQIIMVVFIPLSVEAGIRGVLGVDGSGGGDTTSCAAGDLRVTGSLIPRTGVEGYAEAAIDAVFVEAGVTGVLQLITLQFPFTVGLGFTGSTKQAGQQTLKKSAMTVDASLDLILTLLSGYFAAYVEVCYIVACERAEATIFSWDGPRITTPLYEFEFQVDLEPLAQLQAMSPGGN